MKKSKLIPLLFFLLPFLTVQAQRAGISIGPSFKKPLFIHDTLTEGNAFKGLGASFGFFPDDEETFKMTFDFNYYFPMKDSVVVKVNPTFYGYPTYSDELDAASVTAKNFSLGMTYGYTIPNELSSLLYLDVALGWHYQRYKFEYDYDKPNFEMLTDSITTTSALSIGLEIAPYYDFDKFYVFASVLGSLRLLEDIQNDDYHLKIASKVNLGITFGICYLFY